MHDLERALSQTQIHEAELRQKYNYSRRLFQENLDLVDTRKAQEDVAALDAATSVHEKVRREAEAEMQRYYREVEEQEKRRIEDEGRRLREQQAQAVAEAERKAKEEADRKVRMEKKLTAARKLAEEKAKAEEAERRKREDVLAQEKAVEERKQKEEHEAAKSIQQAAEKRAAEERAAIKSAAQTATKDEKTVQLQSRASTIVSHGREAQHQRYLQIHQNLKKFRKDFWVRCKKDANLKTKVGDMRRAIKTSVGQLTEARGANKQPVRSFFLFPYHK